MPSKLKSYAQRRGTPYSGKDAGDLARGAESQAIRNTTRWQRVRDRMLCINPTCPDPFDAHQGRLECSVEVHHVIPLNEAPHLAFVEANLVALCKSCHRTADNMEPIKQRYIMREVIVQRGDKP